MANAINVNFKLDADVKKSMEQACSDMGLSMSAAFTIFAKKVARERRIPFEITADPFYSDSNIRYLERKMDEYRSGTLRVAEHGLAEDLSGVIKWDLDAWEDYIFWQTADKGNLRRINQLIRDISREPFEGIGKPEPLKGSLLGFWSRRIDKEHRLVYVVEGEDILIISCRGHYE